MEVFAVDRKEDEKEMSDIQKAIDFTASIFYKAEDGTPMFPQATERLKETIITALQEKAEREKGCAECKFQKDFPSSTHCFGCARMHHDNFEKAGESE